MNNLVANVQYIDVKDCFIHLSQHVFSKFYSHSLKGVKLTKKDGSEDLYFTIYPYPSKSVKENCIGISCTYANSLNIKPDETIILYALLSVSSVRKIFASPVSEDDFELLEVVSGVVEASLLNQLRIVWPKQTFSIWVSAAVSVHLLVDTLEPDLEYGRLVEDSEIVIGGVKNEGAKARQRVKTVPVKKENMNSILCRIAPLEDVSLLEFPVVDHPYRVYLTTNSIPLWLVARIEDDPTMVWRCEPSNPKCSEHLFFAVNICLINHSDLLDVGKYKTLYASQLLRSQLFLDDSSKVKLTPIQFCSDIIAGILITPCFDLKENESFSLIEKEIHKKIIKIVLKSGNVLINSKGGFMFDNDRPVILTLRPLDLKFGYLSLPVVNNMSISVNSLKSDKEQINLKTNKLFKVSNFLRSVGEKLFEDMQISVDLSFGIKQGLKKSRPQFLDNFLFLGKRGSGKSHFINIFLRKLSGNPYYIHTEQLDCKSLKGKRLETITKMLIEILSNCKNSQPSVLLIEDLDILCSASNTEHDKTEASFFKKRISHKLLSLFKSYQDDNFILIIATASSSTSLDEVFVNQRENTLFNSVLKIPDLSKNDRQEFLEHCIKERVPNLISVEKLNLEYFATITDGFVAADLFHFVEKALFEAWQREVKTGNYFNFKFDDLNVAYKSASALVFQSLKVKKNHELKLENVGGLRAAKDKLVEIIVWPSKYPEIIGQCPLKRQNAALLYGAPGNGKTMLAKAIAGESGLNFITVKGPELMSKYIGESEQGVRKVFENAQAAQPSLLFFDEFESLAPRRGHEQTGVTDRVVNQLLTALDGVEPMTGVIVMAASSRPDIIDPALLRPGRIGVHIHCPFPTKEERVEILNKLSDNIPFGPDVDLKEIADLTEGFSGADLKGLLSTTHLRIFDDLVGDLSESFDPVFMEKQAEPREVSQKDLLAAVEETKPSLSDKEKLKYKFIYDTFEKGETLDMTSQKVTLA